ncbi:MAG TPA: translational GTPase TypA [Chloroflexota bacterium]|jgi:GTP-binding protein|nr:translational GTPase TypA [Chloroflexota bacterium]
MTATPAEPENVLARREDLRNVAIIAHVDHGKTTLVDALLKQSHVFAAHEQVGELIMDSNDLEREKGITILAKTTSIRYRGVKINIIDTPGHADFGGEVERVMGMADGCLLLVDATEGPMPQTRVVLRQALALGLRPIIVVNKIDRANAQPDASVDATHDLLLELAHTPEQLDAPVLFTNGREGTATTDLADPGTSLVPLLDILLSHVPGPTVDPNGPLQLMVSNLDHDNHIGRLAIGRIGRGTARVGQQVVACTERGVTAVQRITGLFTVEALERLPATEVGAGEVVYLSGLADVGVGDTVVDPEHPDALPRILVGEPTLKMQFSVNQSPFAGREVETSSTSRQLRARLDRELLTNVALRVAEAGTPDAFEVSGRGELHLAILVETMRREGFEFEVGRPTVITREIDGVRSEPVEECIITCGADIIGAVTEELGRRGATMQSMRPDAEGATRLTYRAPTRALIGLRSSILTLTRGTGAMATRLVGWEPWRTLPRTSRMGVLVASQSGMAVAYGLLNVQERGLPFIHPGTPVYEGMIIGQNRRDEDIEVNATKQKQKTSVRSPIKDQTVKLVPPREMSLEECLDFIEEDELVEVTPKSIRMRKKVLDSETRVKQRRRSGSDPT